MIVMVNSNRKAIGAYRDRVPGRTGILVNPHSGFKVAEAAASGLPWAIENGAFSGRGDFSRFWDYVRATAALPCRGRLAFVTVPDVFDPAARKGDAMATLARFEALAGGVELAGLPLGFVLQDGADDTDLSPVWSCPSTAAVFVGGSDEFKLSNAAADLCGEARRRGLWVHMGRVNSARRIRHARMASCDSIDGTGITKFHRAKLGMVSRELAQSLLF